MTCLNRPVTLSDLAEVGKLLEVHCSACRPERHLPIADWNGAVAVPVPSHEQWRGRARWDPQGMLISTGWGGDVLRLLLLLSDSFDSIILARAISYPKRYPNELESSCPLYAKLLRSD